MFSPSTPPEYYLGPFLRKHTNTTQTYIHICSLLLHHRNITSVPSFKNTPTQRKHIYTYVLPFYTTGILPRSLPSKNTHQHKHIYQYAEYVKYHTFVSNSNKKLQNLKQMILHHTQAQYLHIYMLISWHIHFYLFLLISTYHITKIQYVLLTDKADLGYLQLLPDSLLLLLEKGEREFFRERECFEERELFLKKY